MNKDPSASAKPDGTGPRGSVAFLLAQIGAHAAARFAERVAEVGLTPPLTGLLGAIAHDPGRSQQQLADRLGLLPSRVVAFVDELEERALVRRERGSTDRRQYALHLTRKGQAMIRRVGEIAAEHDRDLTAALSGAEHESLAELLRRIAEQQGLTPGVHPGYRRMGRDRSD